MAAWLTHLTPDLMEWLPVPPVNTAAARAAEEASGSRSPRMVALIAVCLGFFVIQLDVTIVNVALPTIQHEIGGTVGGLQWVVDSYTLALASVMLTAGSMADRRGARRVFLVGLAGFAAGSAACAAAPSLPVLIAARAVQGLGASALLPCSLALIVHRFPDSGDRARALGVWGALGSAGVALGPVLGGALIAVAGWRSIFLVNVPVCVVTAGLLLRYVPESPTDPGQQSDLPGLLLGIAALAGVTAAFIKAGQRRDSNTPPCRCRLLRLRIARIARRAGSEGSLMAALLEIRDLDVRFTTQDGDVHAVKKRSDIGEGSCLGVVGESGSGKSQLSWPRWACLAGNGRVTGSVRYRGQEMLGAAQPAARTRCAAPKITMIFQDPLTSLTPHMTVGAQIVEALTLHQKMPREEAERRVREMLDYVRIPEGARRMKQYPHELSGGMRQRVMIAMATITGPDLLIADEPTTALDVTVQAQILEILRALKIEKKTAMALISHDMGVIAGNADRVQVMRHGEVVERGPVDEIFYAPRADYTKMLLAAMPRLSDAHRTASTPGSICWTWKT